MNIEIRLVEQYEEGALKALLDESFEREWPQGEWEWLSHQCPLGENLTYVAEDEECGELAASYSLLPMLVRYDGERLWASLANRASVREGWRRQGLFVRMGEHVLGLEERYGRQLTLGVPNMKALPGHMKVGWKIVDMLWLLEKRRCQAHPFHSAPVEKFGPEFDGFCAENDERFAFIVCKDSAWANWRYVDRPGVEYRRYACMNEGHMQGYVVLKDYDGDGLRKTHIIDMQAANADALNDLLDAAESQAAGRDVLNLWGMPGNPYEDALRERGFMDSGEKSVLIAHRNYGTLREWPRSGAKWFCFGDADVY